MLYTGTVHAIVHTWRSDHPFIYLIAKPHIFSVSPFDPSDEEHQVAVDFGAVDKLVDVAGVNRLRRLQAGGADAVARWNRAARQLNTKDRILSFFRLITVPKSIFRLWLLKRLKDVCSSLSNMSV